MKTLRYILSALMMLVLTSAFAANTQSSDAKLATISTSRVQSAGAMVSASPEFQLTSYDNQVNNRVSVNFGKSGSNLPVAAATGVTTAEDINPSRRLVGPRREGEDPFGGEDIGGTDNPDEPGSAPLSDAIALLLLMALGYALVRLCQARKTEKL